MLFRPRAEDWFDQLMISTSAVQLKCRTCDHVGDSAINWICKPGYEMQCRCSGSKQRLQILNKLLADLPSRIRVHYSPDEWDNVFKGRYGTILDAYCNECNKTFAVPLRSAQRKHYPCGCSKHERWESKTEEFDRVIENSRFVCTKRPARLHAKARIELQCTVCNEVTTPTLTQFIGDTVGCECTSPDAQAVRKIVESLLLGSEILIREPTLGIKSNAKRPTALRCDFKVIFGNGTLLMVECDGGYHFSEQLRPPPHVNTTPKHDLMKEQHILGLSVPMLRIDNATARQYPAQTKRSINEILSIARAGRLAGVRRISHRKVYINTVYSRLRLGTPLEVDDPVLVL